MPAQRAKARTAQQRKGKAVANQAPSKPEATPTPEPDPLLGVRSVLRNTELEEEVNSAYTHADPQAALNALWQEEIKV